MNRILIGYHVIAHSYFITSATAHNYSITSVIAHNYFITGERFRSPDMPLIYLPKHSHFA